MGPRTQGGVEPQQQQAEGPGRRVGGQHLGARVPAGEDDRALESGGGSGRTALAMCLVPRAAHSQKVTMETSVISVLSQ